MRNISIPPLPAGRLTQHFSHGLIERHPAPQARQARRRLLVTAASPSAEPDRTPPIQISPANRWTPPVNRIAPRITRELSKTACIQRAERPLPLPYASKQIDLHRIASPSPSAKAEANAASTDLPTLLAMGIHDGLLVIHRGEIVAEHTVAGFDARHQTHNLNSASKVAVACIAGILAGSGALDLQASLETYVPEAADCGYRGVSVQCALDMQSGVELQPTDEFYALGVHPQQGDRQAEGVYRLTMGRPPRDLSRAGIYRPCCTDTDIVGLACERVSGRPYTQLLTELWQSMGAAENADFLVDDYRTPVFNGGLVPTLHDLGRFGQMLLQDGRVGDAQVVPKAFLDDCFTLTPSLTAAFDGHFYGHSWPSAAFHNSFFLDANRPGAALNYGAFGNILFIDRKKQMVAVLMSAWPKPNDHVLAWKEALYAIGDEGVS